MKRHCSSQPWCSCIRTSSGSTPNARSPDGGAAGVPSHLTSNRTLTSEERERRLTKGLCLYCGGEGHKAGECSKAQASKVRQGWAAKTASAPLPTPLSPPGVAPPMPTSNVVDHVRLLRAVQTPLEPGID